MFYKYPAVFSFLIVSCTCLFLLAHREDLPNWYGTISSESPGVYILEADINGGKLQIRFRASSRSFSFRLRGAKTISAFAFAAGVEKQGHLEETSKDILKSLNLDQLVVTTTRSSPETVDFRALIDYTFKCSDFDVVIAQLKYHPGVTRFFQISEWLILTARNYLPPQEGQRLSSEISINNPVVSFE